MLKTGDRFKKLSLSGAGNSCNTEYFAAACGKRYVIEYRCTLSVDTGNVSDLESVDGIIWFGSVNVKLYLLPTIISVSSLSLVSTVFTVPTYSPFLSTETLSESERTS